MTRTEIRQWLMREFEPIIIATPPPVVDQIIESAIRYWNTHSGFRIARMYPVAGGTVFSGAPDAPSYQNPGTKKLVVSPEFKTVVEVRPATGNQFLFNSHPLWTLLGVTIIDNITSDLILLGESFRNYRYYIGNDFKFQWEMAEDSDQPGALYMTNLPIGTTAICAIGTKRISSTFAPAVVMNDVLTPALTVGDKINVVINKVRYPNIDANVPNLAALAVNINTAVGAAVATIVGGYLKISSLTNGWSSCVLVENGSSATRATLDQLYTAAVPRYAWGTGDENIKNENILEFLLYYSKALLLEAEARLIRKADTIGVKTDGADMMTEAKALREEWEKKLNLDGRWVALAFRG